MKLRSRIRMLTTATRTAAVLGFVLGAVLTGNAREARAQSSGFAIDRYEPSQRGSDWYANESLDFRGHVRPAVGVILDWAYRPLEFRDVGPVDARHTANLIVDQVFAHVGGSVVFADRVRAGVSLPVAIYQDGKSDSSLFAQAPDKSAVGDLRLTTDVRLFGEYAGPFSLALGAQVHLPTGVRRLFTSDGTVRVSPRLLVAGSAKGIPYAFKTGVMIRPFDGTFEGRPLGSELFMSAAIGLKANDRFIFGPEIIASTVVDRKDSFLHKRATPVELLVTGRVTLANVWQIGAAIGPGFTQGDGSPSMRVLASLDYVPDVCIDKDGDGICANVDACPERDGERSPDPKLNGCPRKRPDDEKPKATDDLGSKPETLSPGSEDQVITE